jgi:hypothetical protein
MKHKHAELMAQYAQDAMETETPWERWEVYDHIQELWVQMFQNPVWRDEIEYRRKPRTIIINGYEVPEPVREPLQDWQEYYMPSITFEAGADCYTWRGDKYDNNWLEKGIIHLTKEAAETHAKALLSFTKTQP